MKCNIVATVIILGFTTGYFVNGEDKEVQQSDAKELETIVRNGDGKSWVIRIDNDHTGYNPAPTQKPQPYSPVKIPATKPPTRVKSPVASQSYGVRQQSWVIPGPSPVASPVPWPTVAKPQATWSAPPTVKPQTYSPALTPPIWSPAPTQTKLNPSPVPIYNPTPGPTLKPSVVKPQPYAPASIPPIWSPAPISTKFRPAPVPAQAHISVHNPAPAPILSPIVAKPQMYGPAFMPPAWVPAPTMPKLNSAPHFVPLPAPIFHPMAAPKPPSQMQGFSGYGSIAVPSAQQPWSPRRPIPAPWSMPMNPTYAPAPALSQAIWTPAQKPIAQPQKPPASPYGMPRGPTMQPWVSAQKPVSPAFAPAVVSHPWAQGIKPAPQPFFTPIPKPVAQPNKPRPTAVPQRYGPVQTPPAFGSWGSNMPAGAIGYGQNQASQSWGSPPVSMPNLWPGGGSPVAQPWPSSRVKIPAPQPFLPMISPAPQPIWTPSVPQQQSKPWSSNVMPVFQPWTPIAPVHSAISTKPIPHVPAVGTNPHVSNPVKNQAPKNPVPNNVPWNVLPTNVPQSFGPAPKAPVKQTSGHVGGGKGGPSWLMLMLSKQDY